MRSHRFWKNTVFGEPFTSQPSPSKTRRLGKSWPQRVTNWAIIRSSTPADVSIFESWLPEYYDLADYTSGRFRDELRVANLLLDLLDGGKPRNYGNNCTIGRGDDEQPMDPILDELFVAARGTITERPVDPRQPAFTRLGHFNGDGKTFAQLRAEIEDARSRGEWVIYMFHGVGEGTHGLFVEDEVHRQLIAWLDQERDSIWTAPVVEIASHLQSGSGA